MSFDNATDIHVIKRDSVITIGGFTYSTSSANDHFKVLVYKLGSAGAETLVMTGADFSSGDADITPGDSSAPAYNQFLAEDGEFYRIDTVAYDSGETTAVTEDETYVYVRPDVVYTDQPVVTVDGIPLVDALDEGSMNKLLWRLGQNSLHGEFSNPSGYTDSSVIRGYGSISESEAESLLEASDSPGDSGVLFKMSGQYATLDNGSEHTTTEQEVDL